MIKQSLGLIETVGLAAAIEAADTAVKSANVKIIGYELTKGGGMVMVKMLGEVGAVNAAISAATASAAKVNKVVSTKVIARMGEGLELMVTSHETPQAKVEPAKADAPKVSQEIPVTTVSTDIEDMTLDCSSLAAQDVTLDDSGSQTSAAEPAKEAVVPPAKKPTSSKKKHK
ncbi:BMC domain-containing protein, partial [Budvicia aquatica]|uniref:BMC domain-containing protein n=1 Tax=Budvicia aquatica TaxID=82979 RepID=A0A2C6C417_9GAMM